ncbi:hypothetical protein CPB86DRAFT_878677 [Serendipita vermifera]|nr:hypothetical protein CPB86DRAFT_878677 [Serendipita vermifera]
MQQQGPGISTEPAVARQKSLLWVLDPREKVETEEAAAYETFYILMEVPDSELNEYPHKKGQLYEYYIFSVKCYQGKKLERTRGKKWVLISENLEFYRQLSPTHFNKHVMAWGTFRDIILRGGTQIFQNYDIIIPLGLSALSPGVDKFANEGQFNTFIQTLRTLDQEYKKCWPSVKESWNSGKKFLQVQTLDEIAQFHTLSPRPLSELIVKGTEYPTGKGIVLKRSFSGRSHDVIISPTEKDVKGLETDTPSHTDWFKQTWVESLKENGEIRVAICNARYIISRVHTYFPNQDCLIFGDRSRLGHIKGIPYKSILASGPHVFDDQNDIPISASTQFTKELDDFVRETLRVFIEKEEKFTGQQSSLRIFARVDIGIMEDKDGHANWFVNEIERMPNVCLFKNLTNIEAVMAAIQCHLKGDFPRDC